MEKVVFCTVTIEGIHHWPDCDIEEVNYLKLPHRHIFYIRAYAEVAHSNRDVEFIKMKHSITSYIKEHYYSDNYKCCYFGAMSCEDMALELIKYFNLVGCEVSEDDENGTVIMI